MSKQIRRSNTLSFRAETLEHRYMMAGDFAPGDANRDYYVDESDFVLAMKAGKYESNESDETADWSEGDWNGDGRFNSSDHLFVFISGNYRQGSYDEAATDPVNELQPLEQGTLGPVALLYNDKTGDLVVDSRGTNEKVTTLQLTSASGLFQPRDFRAGLFDVEDSETTRFLFDPRGFDEFVFSEALPTGI
ncbi:MAG: hypothetical protein KDB27_22585, partial [Planctomycetales bacterium]|nr:hypothetical protein [Planctomycetales bacterium]